jgi:hypothetical protein
MNDNESGLQAALGGIGYVGTIQVAEIGTSHVDEHGAVSRITGNLDRKVPAIDVRTGPLHACPVTARRFAWT